LTQQGVQLTLLGCLLFGVANLVSGRMSIFTASQADGLIARGKISYRIASISTYIFLLAISVFLLTILFSYCRYGIPHGQLMNIIGGMYITSIFLIPISLFASLVAELVALPHKWNQDNLQVSTLPKKAASIKNNQIFFLLSGWAAIGGIIITLTVEAFAARHWPFVWPVNVTGSVSSVFFTIATAACFAITLTFTASLVFFCARLAWLRTGKAQVNWLGIIIGGIFFLWGLYHIRYTTGAIMWSGYPGRGSGEFSGIIAGGGLFLLLRSLLPNINFRRAVMAFLSGVPVTMYIIVSLQAWFIPTDVYVLWLGGMLCMFVPGIILLISAFDESASKPP